MSNTAPTNFLVLSSPHITQKGNTTRSIMRDVLIALIPVTLAAIYFFGYLVIVNLLVCAIACAGFELLYTLVTTKRWTKQTIQYSSVFNLSCLVTAVILALNLPTTVQSFVESTGEYNGVWGLAVFFNNRVVFDLDMVILCVIASFVAIVLTKMIFGGIGKNFANPAMVGRIFLFLIVGLSAVATNPLFGLNARTSATWLQGDKLTNPGIIGNMFFGYVSSAAVGETSVIAILLGAIYLCVKKVIDWRLPAMIIGSVAIFALLFDVFAAKDFATYNAARSFNKMLANVLSGGLIFGAVFMATDYSTNPNTFPGTVIFAVGIGLLTMLIRVYANYPEGTSFAILFMNILTPLIDKHIVPKPFGYKKQHKIKQKVAKKAETATAQ